MRDRIFRDNRSTRRHSPSPHRNSRNDNRRLGSRRFEPVRSRVVSPVRRTERDYQPDWSTIVNDIARNGESVPRGDETASSKFLWNNLLDTKQVENVRSSTTQNNAGNDFHYGIVTETHGFSGAGTVGPNGPLRRSYAHIHGGFVSPLKENEVGALPKHWEQVHHQQQHVESGVYIFKPNASSSTSTQSSSFVGPLGLCRSFGIGADGYLAEHVHAQMPKPNSQYCSIPVMNRDLNYSEVQRREKNDVVACFNNGGFLRPEFQRPSIVDSIVEKMDGVLGSHGDYLGKGAPWEENEHFVAPKCVDVTPPSKHCVEPLVCRNVHLPEYATDEYRESDGWSLEGYEKDAYSSNHQRGWKGLPVLEHDQYVYVQRGNSDDGAMKTEEQSIHDLDVETLESKYGGNTDKDQIWTDFKTGLPHHQRQCVFDSFEDEDASFDDGIMLAQFHERSNSRYSPVPAERTSRKLRKIAEKSMKRPSPHRIISLPSSSDSYRRRINIHSRLGHRVVPAEDPCIHTKYMPSKKLKRNLCDFFRTAPCSDPSDQSDVKVKEKVTKRSKTEPPEDSKEFKQLVQNAFFKFVKILNENPSLRRKYVEQGTIDTLRCTLCGSKLKEFANTHSLAMHSFNSTKAKHRAEHLGFHKALCVLLGWSDTAASDGLWVQQILPADEAANLRNDLIIWPPVVLIYNSSVAHSDPDKRVIVSIEGLEAILRGMEFGGGKTKVSRGKPANYSILVVTFNATFSGLQEAERLHKFFADKKHGRDELQQIDGSSIINSDIKDTQCIPENVENVLYGNLGNAGDLDKLDFESKKRSVVKSKKEILAIADATLRED